MNNVEKFILLQNSLLNAMVALDKLCMEIGVTYYLSSGTLLGAVRHKGFIPWDYDIDIVMTRDNYIKLMSSHYEDNKYVLVDGNKNSKIGIGFSRFIIKDCQLIKKDGLKQEFNELYIDIFPLDNAKDKLFFWDKVKEKKITMLRRLMYYKAGYTSTSNRKRKFILTVLNILMPKDPARLNSKLYKLCTKQNRRITKSYSNYYSTYGYIKEIQKKEIFGEGKPLNFCGYEFNCPNQPDRFLKNLYGDYMTLPPESKRKTIDLSKYDFYIGGMKIE